MEEKKSFLLYNDYGEQFALLSDGDAGKVLKALFAHENGETEPVLEGAARMLFSVVCRDLDRNRHRYEARCAQNRENGAKGGRPKKTAGFSRIPEKADTETDTETGTDTEAEAEEERREERPGLADSGLPREGVSGEDKSPPCTVSSANASVWEDVPLETYREIWLQCCPSLPAPQDTAHWTAARVRALRDKQVSPEEWKKACEQMEQSDFLTGRAEPAGGRRASHWKCSIDWALKPANWQKILEGTYGGRAEAESGLGYDIEELERMSVFAPLF